MDEPPTPKLRATIEEARQIPIVPGSLSGHVLSYGSIDVRWYTPHGTDVQVPHDRDELYVVVSGEGSFVRAIGTGPFDDPALPIEEERVPFGPGDVLLVPAGAVHRFESFSADLAAWSIFYGPEGGQVP